MLIKQLPHTLNLKKLTEQEIQLSGGLPIGQLKRLLELVEGPSSTHVEVELSFKKDEQSRQIAEGKANCEVLLTCQRCLEQYKQPLDVNLNLAFVQSEAESQELSEQYDPVIIEDEHTDMVSLVEDDLILALPIVAMHPDEQCQTVEYSTDEEVVEAPERENPFKVLEALKSGNTNVKGENEKD